MSINIPTPYKEKFVYLRIEIAKGNQLSLLNHGKCITCGRGAPDMVFQAQYHATLAMQSLSQNHTEGQFIKTSKLSKS